MATYLLAVLGAAVMTNQLILLLRGTGWVSEGQSWVVLAMFAGAVTCLHLPSLLVSCWYFRGRTCLNEGQQLSPLEVKRSYALRYKGDDEARAGSHCISGYLATSCSEAVRKIHASRFLQPKMAED